MKKFLTTTDFNNFLPKHDYVVLRNSIGETFAINTKVRHMMINRLNLESERKTTFVGYKPCCFMEYISRKAPFITIPK